MKILQLENQTYTLEKIPEYVDDQLRFAVLDNSNPAEPDYFFIPLIFLESFLKNDDLKFTEKLKPVYKAIEITRKKLNKEKSLISLLKHEFPY